MFGRWESAKKTFPKETNAMLRFLRISWRVAPTLTSLIGAVLVGLPLLGGVLLGGNFQELETPEEKTKTKSQWILNVENLDASLIIIFNKSDSDLLVRFTWAGFLDEFNRAFASDLDVRRTSWSSSPPSAYCELARQCQLQPFAPAACGTARHPGVPPRANRSPQYGGV
jgi:hypothetical protein